MKENRPFDVTSYLDPEATAKWSSGAWKGQLVVAKLLDYLKELGRKASVQEIEMYIESTKKDSVVSYLDDDAKKAWSAGTWKGKLVVAKLMEFLKELGRPASVADVEAYVASAETSHLDTPLTKAEMEARGWTFDERPMTILGSRWLSSQQVSGRPANQVGKVWDTMVIRSKREGGQLKLTIVQGLLETVSKNLGLEQFGQDSTVPDFKAGEMMPCEFCECGEYFLPQMRTVVKDSRVLKYSDGPLQNKPIRTGNFRTIKGPDGQWTASSLCSKHRKDWLEAKQYAYPYEDALAIAEAANADEQTAAKAKADATAAAAKRDAERELIRKQAAEQPKLAEKHRNRDIRGMRDFNRNDRKQSRRRE